MAVVGIDVHIESVVFALRLKNHITQSSKAVAYTLKVCDVAALNFAKHRRIN